MYLHYTNSLIKRLFPHFTWNIKTSSRTIYLTFDDGPIPEVTPWVLAELEKYKAKATFFCVGDNIKKHANVFEAVLEKGHSIGNHTFNHLNGWKTAHNAYLENVRICEDYIPDSEKSVQKLFRPPHGRLTASQSKALRENYQIIMWSVLSGDFDRKLAPEVCLKKSVQHTQAGSIVVFHDSLKAEKNLRYVLPKYLEYFDSQGFNFEKL